MKFDLTNFAKRNGVKYGMEHITIELSTNNTFLVYADTERFGEHEIMFESYKKEDCERWLRECKAIYWKDLTVQQKEERFTADTVEEMLEELTSETGITKVQISNRMYHSVQKDRNGNWIGRGMYGWETIDFKGFELTKKSHFIAKRVSTWGKDNERTKTETLKMGTACTW